MSWFLGNNSICGGLTVAKFLKMNPNWKHTSHIPFNYRPYICKKCSKAFSKQENLRDQLTSHKILQNVHKILQDVLSRGSSAYLWLIVTALWSVIGHVFLTSVQQCVCRQCSLVQWTVDTGEYRFASLGCNYRAG